MKGDISRETFDVAKHYSGVRMQQGRVQTDADWNEQEALQRRRTQIEARDVIGRCGAPEDNATLRFPLTYRGRLLQVDIGLENAEYTLREGDYLVIRHETEELHLTREMPVASRRISRS